jgi:hypothetical protein
VNPRYATIIKVVAAIIMVVVLILLFPLAMGFVETAARELRYFWWLILLVLFAGWLIWGLGRKKK